jgi:hypothetical protein
VPSYLVEIYMPRSRAHDARVSASRARSAADELSRAGVAISYVRTTYLPDDETCFHLFEAGSASAVDSVCTCARLDHARVVPAVEDVDASP